MAKYLADIASTLPKQAYELQNAAEQRIQGLTLDSRYVAAGDLFFALQGLQFKASAFVAQAIDKGAAAICCDKQYKQDILSMLPDSFPLLVVNNLQAKISQIASRFYDDPSEKMHVVAITGTNGKTSVSHYVAQVFNHSAVIGTMGYGSLDNLQSTSHTTPNAIALQALFAQFYESNIQTVSMEASSHGLSQRRLAAVKVNTVVLTNFSRDHLDYHGSLESYKQAKKKLFTEFNAKNIILNYDDNFGKELYQELSEDKQKNIIAYTMKPANVSPALLKIQQLQATHKGFDIKLSYQSSQQNLSLALLGHFNIENAMATLAVLLASGETFERACRKLETLQPVKGRMQQLKQDNACNVVIDYAHTPQALTLAIEAVKQHNKGKVICVFGCGGDRDKGKRPLMAQAASTADMVVVTNDNPRTEDPVTIVKEICAGFGENAYYKIEYDREKAIRLAMGVASHEDIVLVAGKGHEKYQIIGEQKINFSDEQVVREYMEEAA